MRIIAGEFRSRRLFSPPEDVQTRPIPDRVKESLFSILRGNVEGAVVYDAFAGTGAIGLEALSRGAARCVFVERDRRMAQVLEQNIAALGVNDRCEVVVGDALGPGALARCPDPVDLVFFDPPYPLMRDELGSRRIKEQLAHLVRRLAPDGFAVLRTPWPLLSVPDDASGGEPVAGARERRATPKRGKNSRRRTKWEQVWTVGDGPMDAASFEADDEDDALDDGAAPRGPGEPVPPKPKPRPIDLTIAGAVGPETHEYSAMAVHFFAKPKVS